MTRDEQDDTPEREPLEDLKFRRDGIRLCTGMDEVDYVRWLLDKVLPSMDRAIAAWENERERLSRLQAVAALDENFGYALVKQGRAYCLGCTKWKGQAHADGCPVGLYEKGGA